MAHLALLRRFSSLLAPATLALVACATATTEETPVNANDGGSGGAAGTTNPSGGAGPSGGTTPTGGQGGASSGGASGQGGSASGGASGQGGSAPTGGTSGTSGSSGAGGSGGSGGSGKGGSSPFGGATMGGSAGQGGAAGTGGSSGAGGSAGGGGSGGGPVDPPTGECATNPMLELRYKPNQTGDSIAFDLRLTNTGEAPIAANQIEFHYYISQEESAWQDRVLDVYAIQAGNYMDLKTTGTVSVDPLMPVLGTQTHVVRIRQTSGALLPPGAGAYLNLTARLQPAPAAPNQVQTDDFSYDAAHAMLALWDHVAVFVNGALAWGCTPEA